MPPNIPRIFGPPLDLRACNLVQLRENRNPPLLIKKNPLLAFFDQTNKICKICKYDLYIKYHWFYTKGSIRTE